MPREHTAEQLLFDQAGRVPEPEDNVAIATRRLEAGTRIEDGSEAYRLTHTVLEGHRFVRHPIAEGGALLSWGLPFGHALRELSRGEYVCNEKILKSIRHRRIDFPLPEAPNFKDHLAPYDLDEAAFRPGVQVPRHETPRTFPGFRRDGGRGVGTRNLLVVLGTSSRSSGFVRALADRLAPLVAGLANVDGVAAVTHTEGGGQEVPNNKDFLLRTLAGWMVHPNVGAVLAVDVGDEPIGNGELRRFMIEQGYPLRDVTHSFFTMVADFAAEQQRALEMTRYWLPIVDGFVRTEEPLSNLKLALQCGGSDAFSGVSGNPLAGWVAKEVIRHGGAANLAETDELIGAESYVLSNVRDLDTARAFLDKIAVFKERAAWHGHSAEGNPSGGNQYRGLYNIVLKSIGAARKKHPDVRLDYVIDYAQPMSEPGYYFMDSPGNDLESIAGQVASGANLILFITGNGSITNFPFVPTLKYVTTTGRWEMLSNEMDVNAGRYQDGVPMEVLGAECFEQVIAVASGQQSLGEKAGHSQVSIWRDWHQTGPGGIDAILQRPKPNGAPLPVRSANAKGAAGADGSAGSHPAAQTGGAETFRGFRNSGAETFRGFRNSGGISADRVGLIFPTSLCSGQVAGMIADDLNKKGTAGSAVSRYVALAHTEGCGAAPGYSLELLVRTVRGHLGHPMVGRALVLEHGCEQTVNDTMREFLEAEGLDVSRLGWASIQMDGGIAQVMEKAEKWFSETLERDGEPQAVEAGLEHLRLGLTAGGEVDDGAAAALAGVARAVAAAGGLVVIPENASLLGSDVFRRGLLANPEAAAPSLGYGEPAASNGLHIMETPTGHAVETLTGLGATGVEVMLAHLAGAPMQGHPMIPLLQISNHPATVKRFGKDLDLSLTEMAGEEMGRAILERVLEVASRAYVPRLTGQGNTDFQLTRGWLGLSL